MAAGWGAETRESLLQPCNYYPFADHFFLKSRNPLWRPSRQHIRHTAALPLAVMCLGCDSDAISHFGVSTRFFGELLLRFIGEASTRVSSEVPTRFIGEASTRFSSEVPTRFIGEVSTRFESPEQPYGPSELSLGRILGHSSNHRSKLAVLQTSLRETRNSRRLLKPRVARTSGLFLSHRESSGWTASHRTSDLAFRYRSDLAFRDRSDFALR